MRLLSKSLPALGALLLLALPLVAGANPPVDAPRANPARRHRPVQVLLDMNDALRTERSASGVFRIRKSYGFEYSHRFEGDRGSAPIIFSVQGPALPRKHLGLTFELRF